MKKAFFAVILLTLWLGVGPLPAATYIDGIEVVTGRKIVNPDIDGGTIDSSTIGRSTIALEHFYYVDANRTDTYTADGGPSRPYLTILAALTAINADAAAHAAAGHYELTNYVVIVAPGTYSDNLTTNNQKYLRIEAPAGGVFITGTIAITQTQQTGDYYSRLEFVGAEGTRTEKGPALKLAGNITATRNNDSLTYITFKGCWITGNQLYDTDGTWVVHFNGCRVAGTIDTGTFTDADSAVLIETTGWNEFAGAITDKVSLYNVDNAEFYGAVTITPIFDCRITNSRFGSTVSIVATKNLDVDTISLKAIIDRTPTLTGMTIRYLDQVANGTYKGIVDTAAMGAIGVTSVNWAKPANIADSATPAIGAAAGNVVDLDGTTTITGFDTVAAGVTRFVRFTGIRTLTHNGTSLILPGARNLTTAVGDRAIFISLGSGNWECHEFLKADGRSLGDLTVVTHNATESATSASMYGSLHVVTGEYTISIPTIAVGMNAEWLASTAAVMCIDVTTGTDILILNGQPLTAGNKACTDGTINNQLRLKCPIAGKCTVNSVVGLAIDGGA